MKITFLIATIVALCIRRTLGLSGYKFPNDFLFGAGTSAFQVEGAWNVDGKSPSLWDHISQTYPQLILDGSNGNVACDSYNRWREDIALVKSMGLNFYKFSISWSRLLPNGTTAIVNKKAVTYYNNLINGLIKEKIEPHCILFNFDMPMVLENKGGFMNSSNIQHFVKYADLAFKLFGDRVKTWVTFNEAHAYCKIIYVDLLANVQNIAVGTEPYKCGHNLLLAHARAFNTYVKKYQAKQNGKVGMAFSCDNYIPLNPNSSADVVAANRAREFVWGWFAHPIFVGNYPKVMIDQIAKLSKAEGLKSSRLPAFTPDEIKEIKDTAHFVGFNPLFTHYTWDISNQTLPANPQYDMRIGNSTDAKWDTRSAYVSTPQFFRNTINWIWKYTEGKYPLYITEHGLGDGNKSIKYPNRQAFFQDYLDQVLLAINEDKINIKFYCVWQMMDTMYFFYGNTLRFGLAHVDFTSPNRTRKLRNSATYYKKVIQNKVL